MSYNDMLTTKGMKFSGYGKKPTKQWGIQPLDFFAFFFFTAFLPFFFFPTVLCSISGFHFFAAFSFFFFEDFLADFLAAFFADFFAVLGVFLEIYFGALVRQGMITNGGITASPIRPAAAIGITTTSSPGFIGSGSIALCVASDATTAMSFTASSVFSIMDLSSLSSSMVPSRT
jgi:hypothetical protein